MNQDRMQWLTEVKFWDQVFPSLPYAFQRSQEIMKEHGYDHILTAKSMQVYCRTVKILQGETRIAFKQFGTI